jgi:hypothetical protein
MNQMPQLGSRIRGVREEGVAEGAARAPSAERAQRTAIGATVEPEPP